MPIENRDLKPGTRLVAKYHKQTYIATVEYVAEEGKEGRLLYKLEDGRTFKSPSAAGTAITGKACNGWAFWSIETAQDAPATELTEAPAAKEAATPVSSPAEAPAPPAEPEVRKPIYKLPNQKGAPEGQTRWYCPECKKGFLAQAGQTPESCPEGHKSA